MKDFASLRNRIAAAVAIAGKDRPYELLNQGIHALAVEMGELTTSRTARVKFDINGHAAALTLEAQGSSSRFMLQTAQVGDKPFALRDAAEFARIIAVAYIPELCEKLMQEEALATEEVANAIRIVKSVRAALKSI